LLAGRHEQPHSPRGQKPARHRGPVDDEEEARRWWNLFPGRKTEDDKAAESERHELEMLMADSERLQERRQRLSSETWIETVLNFGRWFRLAAGRVDSLAAEAGRRGRRWPVGGIHAIALALEDGLG